MRNEMRETIAKGLKFIIHMNVLFCVSLKKKSKR